MSVAAARAAALWGFAPSGLKLAAQRENAVWRVEGRFALRLHRPGYRTLAELQSELDWMAMLADGGLTVPRPIPSLAGKLVEMVEDTPISVLTWLPGRMVGAQGALDGITDRPGYMRKLGALLARLHELSDAWTPPPGFTRPRWDHPGLTGEAPLWGPFWENPDLTPDQRRAVLEARDRADRDLTRLAGTLDFGLIHADAITENVMIDGDTLMLIDFDDGGWGFRAFDLATVLMRQLTAPDYPALRAALVQGYARPMPALDLLLMLRALTYLGWIIPRMDEPGAVERNRRLISVARHLAEACLGKPETGDGLWPFGGHKEKSP